MPRVLLVPGIDLIGLGTTPTDARITADIAKTCLSVITDLEKGGRFESYFGA
jgi:rhamnose utilization protein RhaD (predicted bifunctional aldolase and dehydrogenase)